jgi:hypothetical protein
MRGTGFSHERHSELSLGFKRRARILQFLLVVVWKEAHQREAQPLKAITMAAGIGLMVGMAAGWIGWSVQTPYAGRDA